MKIVNQNIQIKYKAILLASFLLFLATFTYANLAPVYVGAVNYNTRLAAATSPDDKGYDCSGKTQEECLSGNPIVKYLNIFIKIFIGIVGVGSVLMIIVAGIQYITARDDPGAVAAAKKRITNVVIGLAMFIFLWAFLEWLIPGGVFK